eukprot:Gregarina_sp_Poly_1__9866@NODE_639_length_7008_cov_29_446477_g488_i0_p3_GENE_NODE_639_length_7008_cov_29_446477_g488_i0NODE_639_length_7008_cov_29_446477_g488_i0_p3_ORF_typecomplete_len218_score33_32TFIIA_gamma_N/PF02268_16/0_19_NODE_639_length_7008_cov_29_446477_g488_i017452398
MTFAERFIENRQAGMSILDSLAREEQAPAPPLPTVKSPPVEIKEPKEIKEVKRVPSVVELRRAAPTLSPPASLVAPSPPVTQVPLKLVEPEPEPEPKTVLRYIKQIELMPAVLSPPVREAHIRAETVKALEAKIRQALTDELDEKLGRARIEHEKRREIMRNFARKESGALPQEQGPTSILGAACNRLLRPCCGADACVSSPMSVNLASPGTRDSNI